MLKAVSLSKRHDGDTLFAKLNLTLGRGDRVGLVGPNGTGEATLLNVLAGGAAACIEVTLLDALVFARSQFSHSMNYRSVVVFGCAERIVETEPKLAALAALCDRLAPGRSHEARPPTAQELTATMVLAVPIREASAKRVTRMHGSNAPRR